MSDEKTTSGPPATVPSGIFEHYCEHDGCAVWGAYGYQIGKQTARYFCLAHRGDGERFIGRA